jgi:hypothetical protein
MLLFESGRGITFVKVVPQFEILFCVLRVGRVGARCYQSLDVAVFVDRVSIFVCLGGFEPDRLVAD